MHVCVYVCVCVCVYVCMCVCMNKDVYVSMHVKLLRPEHIRLKGILSFNSDEMQQSSRYIQFL